MKKQNPRKYQYRIDVKKEIGEEFLKFYEDNKFTASKTAIATEIIELGIEEYYKQKNK